MKIMKIMKIKIKHKGVAYGLKIDGNKKFSDLVKEFSKATNIHALTSVHFIYKSEQIIEANYSKTLHSLFDSTEEVKLHTVLVQSKSKASTRTPSLKLTPLENGSVFETQTPLNIENIFQKMQALTLNKESIESQQKILAEIKGKKELEFNELLAQTLAVSRLEASNHILDTASSSSSSSSSSSQAPEEFFTPDLKRRRSDSEESNKYKRAKKDDADNNDDSEIDDHSTDKGKRKVGPA